MKQTTLYILSLITVSNLVNAGVIRSTCINDEGIEIPCKKVVEKKEDFGINNLSKRQWGFGQRSRKNRNNNNNWWGRNRWNTDSNANIEQNPPVSNAVASNNFEEEPANEPINPEQNNWNGWTIDENSWDMNNDNSNSWNNWWNGDNSIWNWWNNKGEDNSYDNWWDWGNWWNNGKNNNDDNTWGNIDMNNDDFWNNNEWNNNDWNNNDWNNNWNNDWINNNVNEGNNDWNNNWNNENTWSQPEVPVTNNDNNNAPEITSKTIVPETTSKTIPPNARTTKTVPGSYATQNVSVPTQTPETTSPSTNNQNTGNLPIKEFTMTGFNNCNQQQTQILQNLIEDIKTYRAAAVYVLNNQNEDETYQKIFLKYYKDASTLSKVQKVFDNINNMSTAEAYCETNQDDACADGAMAWTYLYSKEFHVCPSFFSDAMFGTIAQRASEGSSIVLHELTHCHGTDDYAYGEQGVSTLDATHAAGNADTYRLFSMSSIYYLNERGNGLSKRDDDFLNESIDFRTEPFKDKVIIRPNLDKRGDDFLSESIDFRSEPFKDKVVVRPNNP